MPAEGVIEQYLNALKEEIEMWGGRHHDRRINTIYIGGGTPSVLPDGAMLDLISKVRTCFDVDMDASITIEANPNSFTAQKAKEYKSAGCNRLSFGLQAIKDEHLKMLNRKHDFIQCKNAIGYALDNKITDINVDILLGIPTQNIWDVHELLREVVGLPITHISAYSLINEPGTSLTKKLDSGALLAQNQYDVVNFYDFAVDFLADAGFKRYEISNFSKPGFESKHNLNYWDRGEFLGLGLAAFSFCEGAHWENESDMAEYLRQPTRALRNYEPEDEITAKEEIIMLALRTERGLEIKKYNEKFETDFLREHHHSLEFLCSKAKLLVIEDGYIKATNFYMTNTIIAQLFEFN